MCGQDLQTQCETTQVREHGMGAALFGFSKLYGRVPGGQAEFLRVPHASYNPIRVPEGPPDDRFVYFSDVLSNGVADRRGSVGRGLLRQPPASALRGPARLRDLPEEAGRGLQDPAAAQLEAVADSTRDPAASRVASRIGSGATHGHERPHHRDHGPGRLLSG